MHDPRLVGCGERAQLGVPVRLERICHQAVVRIDTEVASLSKLRFIPGALHLLAPHPVHLLGAGLELVLHGQSDLQRKRADGLHQ